MTPLPWFALAVLAGVSTWSIAEYLLHRFLGHDRRTWPNAFADEHTRHHSVGDYFAPTWKKTLVAVAIVPCAAAVSTTIVGLPLGLCYAVSFAAMYMLYELLHRRLHTHAGITGYGRLLRRHHFHHHFGNPHSNHGVTSPLWDIVFRTYERPEVIRVPEKLRMRWLRDDDARWTHDYRIVPLR